MVPDDQPRPDRIPDLTPWNAPGLWTFDSYCVASEVVHHFLTLSSTDRDANLESKLGLAYEMAAEDGWMVDMMAFALRFIKNSSWFWPVMFRR